MSNYRRLISYIYAYEGSVKGKNIGYAKVEVRSGQCRIYVSVKRVYVGRNDIGVYLLSPGAEIPLGRIFIRGGSGEFRITVSADNIDGKGHTADQCYGLTIHDSESTWQSYTTIWEDAVAHAAEVELADVTAENVRKQKMAKMQSPAGTEKGPGEPYGYSVAREIERELEREEMRQQESGLQKESQQGTGAQKEYLQGSGPHAEKEPEQGLKWEPRQLQAESVPADISEDIPAGISGNGPAGILKNGLTDIPESIPADITENTSASISKGTSEHISETTSENISEQLSKNTESEEDIASPLPPETALDNKAVPKNAAPFWQRQAKAQRPAASAPEDPVKLAELDRQEQEQGRPNQFWNRMQERYARVLAFDYDKGCEILSIKPQDIGLLPREIWSYGNNSFLLHGYYSYRHLILAKLNNPQGEPRYLLGVPGHYFSNEKYMAAMFGFPHFVIARKQPDTDGRFGYWYTDIRL